MMQISCFNYLTDSSVANTSCGIVDNTAQCFLVVRIGHNTKIGNDILDFFALIEREPTVYAIWYTVLTHLFLERTALGISTIEDGKIAVVAPLLSTNPLDIVTHDDGLLLVAIGRFQSKTFALFVLAEDILAYLPFVLTNQRVGSFYDKLCRTVILF